MARELWHGPLPGTPDKNPSFSARDTAGTTLVKCHAGCPQDAVIAALRDRGLWEQGARQANPLSPAGRNGQLIEVDDARRTSRAIAIWAEAGNIEGTAGATYLFKRGIDLSALPRNLNQALRWHPSCPWESGRHPCVIGLFTDAITNEPRAIHRIAVTPAGDKVGRMALGPMAGCVIRVWPDEEVTDGLVLGEGIETTLAAATCIEHKGTLLQPAWAAASAGNMAKFPVLGGIEALTLLVDADESGTGQRAADECSARWTAAGKEVIRLVPRHLGSDFNDIIEAPR